MATQTNAPRWGGWQGKDKDMSALDYRRSVALIETAALSVGQDASGAALVELAPYCEQGSWSLRGNADDQGFTAAIGAAFDGLALPRAVGETSEAGGLVALCLGPDEWLLVNTDRQTALSLGDDAPHHSLVNVSDQYAVLDVAGPMARHLLSKCVQIDLSPEAFAVGSGARTLAANTQVVIRLLDDSPRFRLMTRRSFGPYLWAWLQDACREYA